MKINWLLFFFIVLQGVKALAQLPEIVLPLGHQDVINQLIYHPDGRRIASCSDDKTVKVWDLRSGLLLQNIELRSRLKAITYSKDGKILIAGGQSRLADHNTSLGGPSVTLIDMETERQTIIGESDNWITSIHMSPDGKEVAAGGFQRATVFDLVSRKPVSVFKAGTGHADVRFSNNSKILSVAFGTDVIFWDNVKNELTDSVKIAGVREVIFSPDDQSVLLVSATRPPTVFDLKSRQKYYFKTPKTMYLAAALHPRGQIAALIDSSGNTSFYSKATGQPREFTGGPAFARFKYQEYNKLIAEFSKDGHIALTGSIWNGLYLWNVMTSKLLFKVPEHGGGFTAATLSPDGTTMLTATRDLRIQVWNTATGVLEREISGSTDEAQLAEFSPDGKQLLTAGMGDLRLWDLDIMKPIRVFNDRNENLRTAKFSPTGESVAAGYDSGIIDIFPLNRKRGLRLQDSIGNGITLSFNDIGSYLLNCTIDPISQISTIRQHDLNDGKILQSMEVSLSNGNGIGFMPKGDGFLIRKSGGHLIQSEHRSVEVPGPSTLRNVDVMSPNGKLLLGSNLSPTLDILDLETKKSAGILKANGHVAPIISARFNLSGDKILTASADKSAILWNARTKLPLKVLEGHTDQLNDAGFSPDGSRIVTSSKDQSFKIWDSKSGKLLSTIYALDSADYFVQLPSGYYSATKYASRRLHYRLPDQRFVSYEQLDIKYHRPDLVLEAMGSKNKKLISTYKKAYVQRLEKLGIDSGLISNSYQVPTTRILNKKQIEALAPGPKISLNVEASDPTVALKIFNVWVNGVPVYGSRGKSLDGNKKNMESTVTVELSDGPNVIEASVINELGFESLHEPLYLSYNPVKKSDSTLFFIGIGINLFEQPGYDLHTSVNDVKGLAEQFSKKYEMKCQVEMLLDKDVSLKSVLALREKLRKSKINDRVVIIYSGHGLQYNSGYYLASYQTDFQQPSQNSLPYDVLEHLLDDIPARKKLLLVDACHSGEGGSGERLIQDGDIYELMQTLYVNVGKSTGATVLTASMAHELAQESGREYGLFTENLIALMKSNAHLGISALKDKLRVKLNNQSPATRNETNFYDWRVW